MGPAGSGSRQGRAKKLATAAPIREALWLIRNNVPLDVAFQLDDVTRSAWCIVFSEMDGHQFDWNAMRFKEST